MDDAVLELGELAAVPSVGGSDEITGDALQAVDVVAVALGALVEAFGGILIAAVHATVAVVVDRAVTHVILIHKVNHIGNGLGIVSRVSIDLDVEDVTAAGQLVVGRLDFGLMLWRALVINGNVVTVGVINLVGNSGDLTEVLAVAAGELAAEPLGRRGKHAIVVTVALAELVNAVTHIGYNLDAQLLSLVTLAMMMTHEGYQTLG